MTFIHHTAIIDDGAVLGEHCFIWHWVHICAEAVIGNNCSFGQSVFVGNNAVIGNNVKIQNNVSVYEGVKLEKDVFIGPSVVFTNVKMPRAFIEQKKIFKPTRFRCVDPSVLI